MDLQFCAFAQEGILQSPGTEVLLREALRAGVDLNADPLLLPYLLVVGAHMGGETDLAAALDMVTSAPARILGRRDHGLEVGGRADLVVLEASTLAEVVGGRPARALVVKGGRVVVQMGGRCRGSWRRDARARLGRRALTRMAARESRDDRRA